jgi:peptide deformylase
MSVQPLVFYRTSPEILRRKSKLVQGGWGSVRQLVIDLKDTLLCHPTGVGLAAPQIGVHKRVFVVRLGGEREAPPSAPMAVVNPVILEAAHALPDFDGCLSFPGFFAETVRPHFLRLHARDEHGKAFVWTLEGFDAVVAHHEIDHLDGILLIDRLVKTEKTSIPPP